MFCAAFHIISFIAEFTVICNVSDDKWSKITLSPRYAATFNTRQSTNTHTAHAIVGG